MIENSPPEEIYKTLGQRIRNTRLSRNLTQEGLAELVGLTRTSITNIEKGRQQMALHKLIEFSIALKTDTQNLMPDTNISADSRLKDALKEKPAIEKNWIESALLKYQHERNK